eukprot:CAMPEP_0203956450 /NCGR_PEP_ID=MMETSP0359-20131031/88710_1 /ASSEMBLY_ACC=CAM_ASM_000338 /TAXON_ID=268821 /ORGANISM="Scrippsiella Hangoei, Strain SHTV-5" /LENGTH=31 /DNA_ID= /DNA_START= /DNA_END= /DNA_ORIENTATION=
MQRAARSSPAAQQRSSAATTLSAQRAAPSRT